MRSAWESILTSIGIRNAKIVSFTEAVDYFKNINGTSSPSTPTILIADIDLQVIQELGPQTTSSEVALDTLQRWFPLILRMPSVCIKDVRIRRAKQQEQPQQSWLQVPSGRVFGHQQPQQLQQQQQPETTPLEECPNPFESLKRYSLTKPFKNSALIELLRNITNVTSKRPLSSALTLSLPTPENNSMFLPTTTITTTKPSSYTAPGSQTHSIVNSPESSSSSDDFAHIRSLLVDDNPINRKVVSRMLSKINIVPEVAENGRQAFEAIKAAQSAQNPFQLVFMDVWMPEMNGLEAAAKIREELMSPTEPYIIAMTACVMPGDREKCLDAGMNGYISKPIRKEELDAAIHTFSQLLSGAGAHNAASTSVVSSNENIDCPST